MRDSMSVFTIIQYN